VPQQTDPQQPQPEDRGGRPDGSPAAFSGNCPCLSGEQYADCCGRFHRGDSAAPTAEQLMRSRYSAFVLRDAAYLLRTWHPDTRPRELKLDPAMEWRRLDVVSTSRGGPLDSEGTVEFKAHFRHDGERGVHHETSRFLRVDRRWYYLDEAAS
jgi:SEC-C motif-containing protein